MATAVVSAEPVARRWRLRLPERLPNLKGGWLTAYTVLWAVFLLLAVVGSTRGTYIVMTIRPMWTPYGFATSEDSNGIHVDAVTESGARAAGLKAGDYIVGIDGWTVPRLAPRAAARPHVLKPEGGSTEFKVRAPSGHVRDVRLTYSQSTDDRSYAEAGVNRRVAKWANFLGVIFLPLLFISASILLFIRCRREMVPALLSLSFLMFSAVINAGDQLGVGIDVVNYTSAVATCLVFAAMFAFPTGEFLPRWTAMPFVLLPVIPFLPQDRPVLGVGVGLGFLLLSLAALVSRYRRVSGQERLQLRWAFFGLVVGIFLFMFVFVAQGMTSAWQAVDPRWVAWNYAYINPMIGSGLAAMAIGLMISILRYRLYDADAVIGRSAAYGVLTIGFVALFAASEKIIELLGQQFLGQNIGALAGGIGAALAAVAIAPMHARTHRWAERRFQKALWRLRHGLPALVGDLRETSGVRQIAAATLDTVMEGVRARRAALVAGDTLVDAREIAPAEFASWRADWTPAGHDGLDLAESDRVFPLRVPLEAEGHGRVGWLLLGPRPDGSLFGKAERDAIEEIAEPVARAVQVALTREEREASYERRFAELERMVATLTAKQRPATI